ncbi:MAG: ATP-binding cassette subfamily F protein 3 [Kiritimatiellia bacterium]|jgi:ATP-binding cassette subfamily F protein 3
MIILQQISLQRGPQLLLDKTDTTIQPQKRAAIIGSNGCGKSSLFKLLLKELTLDNGDIVIPPQWRIAHMAQEVAECQRSALDYVLDGDQQLRATEQLIANATASDDHSALAHGYHELDIIDGYTATNRAQKLLHGLGFRQQDLSKPVNDFSGGWRIRLNLAQALMCPSDLLLLDEPTNHLDIDATLWLEQWIKNYQGTLLFISHDRDFIDAIADQILHIEHQSINSYSGNYSAFETQRAQRLALQQASFQKQQQRIGEITQFVNRFKAKATKAKQAQSRLKELERMEKIAPAHIDSPFTFRFSQAEKTSDPLLSLEKSALGYTEKPTLSAVNLTLRSDSRIGLLGPNGAGKSTLVKTLVGDLALINGLRHASEHLKIGYFAQHQLEYLDLQASAILHIQRLSPKVSEQVIRNFLGSFNFHGDKAVAAIKPFSGGEKARLALAIIVWQKPNLLILDEPTNHLDLDMRHALTLALQLYQGALIIISHDRHLLKNTVDDFYLVAQNTLQFFDGDLSDYQVWLKEVLQKSNANSDVGSDIHSDDEENKDVKLAEGKIDKKTQRQLDAAKREKLKPLTNNIKKLERTITKKQEELGKIEGKLADQDLYTDDNKKKLQDLLQQQRRHQSAINTLEDDWLLAQEELEKYTEI